MSARPVVDLEWVLKEKSNGKIKMVDATYAIKPAKPVEEFKQKYYGKFEELIKEEGAHPDFLAERIPDSSHFDLNVAFYPGQFVKFDLYPLAIFQEYVRLLGINDDDHIVVYSRGSGAGMVHAARAWWTLRYYGHDNVSVLDGGLASWKLGGQPTVSGPTTTKLGTWTAKPVNEAISILFEELSAKDADGKTKFDKAAELNFLDARHRDMFTGAKPLGHEAKDATGFHVKGAKNVLMSELVGENGLRSKEEIGKALSAIGYQPDRETIVHCNTGMKASITTLALHSIGIQARLYNGSMTEMARRASHVINGRVDKE